MLCGAGAKTAWVEKGGGGLGRRRLVGERKQKALHLEREEVARSYGIWSPNERVRVQPPQGVVDLDLYWE